MDISEQWRFKGHEKCILETPHNDIKCVLSVKESNFNEKSNVSHFLTVRSKVADPPTPPPDRNISAFFYDSPKKSGHQQYFVS